MFDLKVHHKNPKTGQIETVTPYKLTITNGMRIFTRDGVDYYESGEPIVKPAPVQVQAQTQVRTPVQTQATTPVQAVTSIQTPATIKPEVKSTETLGQSIFQPSGEMNDHSKHNSIK